VPHSILDRYPRAADNAFIIEVTTEKVEDLYNNFDRNAPFIKKDLDVELSEYLVNPVKDIGKEPFIVSFRFSQRADPEVISRLSESVHNYFDYMKQRETRALSQRLRTSLIFLITGLVILGLSIWINNLLNPDASVIQHVFAQGLTIAAWVSLWEALANFLIHWTPHQRMRKLYTRLINAPLCFE